MRFASALVLLPHGAMCNLRYHRDMHWSMTWHSLQCHDDHMLYQGSTVSLAMNIHGLLSKLCCEWRIQWQPRPTDFTEHMIFLQECVTGQLPGAETSLLPDREVSGILLLLECMNTNLHVSCIHADAVEGCAPNG